VRGDDMTVTRRGFRRARPGARWTLEDLAEVAAAVVGRAPEALWSADDVRERLAFGQDGAGPPASSVREALRALERAGRVERVDVWGRVGWGGVRHGYRARTGPARERLSIAV
jgi:hypothetical protein